MILSLILSNLQILANAPEMPNMHKRSMHAIRNRLLDSYGPLESRKCYCQYQCVFVFPVRQTLPGECYVHPK